MGSFPNLESLDVGNTNITIKVLKNILLNSPKLAYCNVMSCENVNNKFVNIASKVKTKRNDSKFLEIGCGGSNIKIKNLSNIPPLIYVFEY